MRIEITNEHVIVRIVVLEKDIGSYIGGRPYNTVGRTVDEKAVLRAVEGTFGSALKAADLHKGVKKLWHDDFMDATRTEYKKPASKASEIMDEARGIKRFNDELYKVLRTSVLFKTLFHVASKEEISVTAFFADPSEGYIGFPRYSDGRGDTDHVVREILGHNK